MTAIHAFQNSISYFTFLWLNFPRFPLAGFSDGPPLDSSKLCRPCVLDEIQSAGDVSALRSMKTVILDKVNRGEVEVSMAVRLLYEHAGTHTRSLSVYVQANIESGYLVDRAWFRRWRLKKSLEIRQAFCSSLL